jgi:hypothetical protein
MLAIQSKSTLLGRHEYQLTIASAYYRFSHRTLTMEVVAYRDIQPGEEVTINCNATTE